MTSNGISGSCNPISSFRHFLRAKNGEKKTEIWQ